MRSSNTNLWRFKRPFRFLSTLRLRRYDVTYFIVGVWNLRCLAVRVAVRVDGSPVKLPFAELFSTLNVGALYAPMAPY